MMRHSARDHEEHRCSGDRGSVIGMDTHSKDGGSRNADGNVPYVNSNPDNRKVNVNWYNLDNSNSAGGVRREVSTQEHPARVRDFVSGI
ncbi:MAG: hypothetical protein Q7S04_02255 [Candidatus Moranbacteria bacterium]|nr:hypothetical protein [Candidatus Moranbacteria bacterium]